MKKAACILMIIFSFQSVSNIYLEESRKKLEAFLPRMIEVETVRDGNGSNSNKHPGSSFSPVKKESFRISEQAVSIRLWNIFIKDSGHVQSNNVNSYYGEINQYVKDEYSPVIFVNWYQAIFFCNWLSQQEGLEPVYRITGRLNRDDKKIKVTINSDANGYRLPFESEWEYVATEYGNKEKVVYDLSMFYNSIESVKIANDKTIYQNGVGMFLYATKQFNVSEWVFDDFSSEVTEEYIDRAIQKKVVRQVSTREGYTLDYRAPAIPYGEAGLVTFRLAQTILKEND